MNICSCTHSMASHLFEASKPTLCSILKCECKGYDGPLHEPEPTREQLRMGLSTKVLAVLKEEDEKRVAADKPQLSDEWYKQTLAKEEGCDIGAGLPPCDDCPDEDAACDSHIGEACDICGSTTNQQPPNNLMCYKCQVDLMESRRSHILRLIIIPLFKEVSRNCADRCTCVDQTCEWCQKKTKYTEMVETEKTEGESVKDLFSKIQTEIKTARHEARVVGGIGVDLS